ncbi:MAG: glycosyltransferase [Alkalinema sp. RU_4_3]|nr:glycosyltransferase [Alkalinema sp. RU_4_3]
MLSIITPVYNSGDFIASCIQNVIDQDCPDIEHVIVDGGSTDGTVDLIRSYADRYPHIRWISEKDKGQSDAMNKGIANAKGEILGILNADDYYESSVLNRIVQLFQGLPNPSFLAGNCNIWDDKDALVDVNKPSHLGLEQLLQGWCVHPFPYNPSAYFYHASLHELAGLFDVDEHFSMDLEFILRAVQVSNVYYHDQIWGNFRIHQDTKTFRDSSNGDSMGRVNRIMRHYRKNLTPISRLKVACIYEYYSNEQIRKTKKGLKTLLGVGG